MKWTVKEREKVKHDDDWIFFIEGHFHHFLRRENGKEKYNNESDKWRREEGGEQQEVTNTSSSVRSRKRPVKYTMMSYFSLLEGGSLSLSLSWIQRTILPPLSSITLYYTLSLSLVFLPQTLSLFSFWRRWWWFWKARESDKRFGCSPSSSWFLKWRNRTSPQSLIFPKNQETDTTVCTKYCYKMKRDSRGIRETSLTQ